MIDSGGSGWDVGLRRISWLTLLGRIETNNIRCGLLPYILLGQLSFAPLRCR